MFNPITYSYLRFGTVEYASEPQTAETACRESSSSSLNGFLKTKPFVKWDNAEFTNVSSFTLLLMCSTHFHCHAGYFLFPSPPPTIFSSLCILKSPESAWQVLFRPPWCCLLLWQLKVIRIGLTTILDF